MPIIDPFETKQEPTAEPLQATAPTIIDPLEEAESKPEDRSIQVLEQAQPLTPWQQVKDFFREPEKERAKAEIAYHHTMMYEGQGLTPARALELQPHLLKAEKADPRLFHQRMSLSEGVKQSYKIGTSTNNMAATASHVLFGGAWDDIKDVVDEEQAKIPPYDEQYVPTSVTGEALTNVASFVPSQLESLKQGGIGAATGAAVGSLGFIFGPEAGLPAMAFMAKLGGAGGAGRAAFVLEGGSIVKTLKEEGVNDDIAREMGQIGGGINAAIESAQGLLFIKQLPGLGDLSDEVIKKSIKTATKNAVINMTKFVATETAQEVTQEAVAIGVENFGKALANEIQVLGVELDTAEEIADRLIETGRASALAFGAMGLPGSVTRFINETRQTRKEAAPTEDAPGEIAELEPGEIAPEELTPEQIMAEVEGQETIDNATVDLILEAPDADLEGIIDQILAERVPQGPSKGPLVEEFRSQVEQVVEPDQAEVVTALIEARARAVDMTADEYIEYHGLEIRVEDGIEGITELEEAAKLLQVKQPKAAVSFTDTSTIIRAFKNADFSSMVHELAHVFRRDIGGADLQIAEEWAGVTDGQWQVENEEKFARGLERYLTEGKAPTPELETVFEKLKNWLIEIYTSVKGSKIDVEISPEIRGVFDRLLASGPVEERTDLFQDMEPVKTRVRKVTGQKKAEDKVLSERLKNIATKAEEKAKKSRLVEEKATKSAIRESTGQRRVEKPTVTERQALIESIKKAAQAARKAASEGKAEGVAVERARLKAIMARATSRRKKGESVRSLKAKIKKELQTTKIKKVSGKIKGKFTPEIQQTLDTLRMVSKLNAKEAEARIADNLARYTEELPPQEVVIENHILEMKARFEGMTEPEELQGLLDQIKALKDEGRMLNELRRFNRSEVNRVTAEKTVEDLGGIPEGVAVKGVKEFTAKTLTERTKQALKTLGKTIMGWDDLMDVLSFKTKEAPGESFISTSNNLLGTKNIEKRGTRESMETINSYYMDAYQLKNGRQAVKKIYDDNNIEITLKKVPMEIDGRLFTQDLTFTKSELRKRAMELMDPSLRDSFAAMGYNKNTAAQIFEALTDQDKQFIDSQLQFYRDYYEEVNKVYKAIYGVNLPINEFYSPISREGITKPVDEGMGEFMREVSFRATAATSGSLKGRVGSILRIEQKSDIGVLERHISEMEHFKAWAEKIRDLNAVWKNTKVRAAVEINHGLDMLALLDNFISDIANGGPRATQKLKGLDWFRTNFTRSVLAVNPDVTIKQLTSFAAYSEKMPVGTFVKNLALFWLNPVKNAKDIYTSELMKNRGVNIDRDLKQAMQSSAHGLFAKHQSFLNMLMLNIQVGDQGAIIIGGWSYYKHLKDQGLSHKEAIEKFEKFTEQTQQSGDITEQSYWQRGGSLAKLVTMFASSPNQYLRKEIGAVRNLAAGRQGVGQTLKTLLIYHAVLPMFFQFVSDRFTWDEEEQKRAMIFGALNGWFIMGDGIDFILRKMLGMKPFNMELPVMSVFHDFLKATDLIDLFDMDADEFFRAVRGLAGLIGTTTGLPLKQFVDEAKGAVDIFGGEYEKGLTELMGYSPYQAEKLSND